MAASSSVETVSPNPMVFRALSGIATSIIKMAQAMIATMISGVIIQI